jgi:hypothetical protein
MSPRSPAWVESEEQGGGVPTNADVAQMNRLMQNGRVTHRLGNQSRNVDKGSAFWFLSAARPRPDLAARLS